MTSISTEPIDSSVERAVTRYRRLLVLYPRSFRAEFGDDLAQAYRDLLLFSADRRGLRWRTTRDLVGSVMRERVNAMRPEKRPPIFAILGIAAAVLVFLVAGSHGVLLFPAVVLIALPTFGLTRFVHAWTVHRAGGGGVWRSTIVGVVSFLPATAAVFAFGLDIGYLVFVAVSGTLIVSAVAGTVWAGTMLLQPRGDGPRRWKRPVLVLVPSIAVLAFIIGASVNSYRNSLGPPGDHSVENASVETEALWQAAHDGDLAEVTRLTNETCADPWVKFPYGNGRHNAKGQAETRELELPDEREAPYTAISDLLGDYQDDWNDRCNQPD